MKRPDGREERLLKERMRRKMKRGMDGNEECVKRSKIGKTRKNTRWKGGERVETKVDERKRNEGRN